MEIYIVQQGDTIDSIAKMYKISVSQLIQNNGFDNPLHLVPGQTLVITYPQQTHTVQEGDTLESIAQEYHVPIMQLLRNNSFLSDRENLVPGETLVISYQTDKDIITNGYAYSFINTNTLIKTLPYLTYLSVFNYEISNNGAVISYGDDTGLVQIANGYGTATLMMLSTMSPQGVTNLEMIYQILLSEDNQKNLGNSILEILQSKGYHGVNVMISGINELNQYLFAGLIQRIADLLHRQGYQLFITINPNISVAGDKIAFDQLDYTALSAPADGITFFEYVWGMKSEPPTPVSSITNIRIFLDYVTNYVAPEKIAVANPLIGYNWELPYVRNLSKITSLTINAAITLAYDTGAIIQFDEISQTPYFYYQNTYVAIPTEHIVWFIDARSIHALNEAILDYGLRGSGVWNVMVYYQQIWTIIISQFNIIKLIPDGFSSI